MIKGIRSLFLEKNNKQHDHHHHQVVKAYAQAVVPPAIDYWRTTIDNKEGAEVARFKVARIFSLCLLSLSLSLLSISLSLSLCRINRDYVRRGWAAETGHHSWGPQDPSQNVHADTKTIMTCRVGMQRRRWGWVEGAPEVRCHVEGRGDRELKGVCLPGA